MNINVTVWNEFRHEKRSEHIAKIYPEGIHGAIASYLGKDNNITVRTATLDEPEHGLTAEVLDDTDVLIWWGHTAHKEVSDEVVSRIQERVLCGMGLICLHSSHLSKIFTRLMGTSCTLKWREIGEKERLWVVDPGHPIAEGVDECTIIEHEEMYGERFDIPHPDALVFVGWFQGGEVFRSGCCYQRGNGRVFYFQPGHETYPIYHDEKILKIIKNAVLWANPTKKIEKTACYHIEEPLEKIL